jgi:hypothetical protein
MPTMTTTKTMNATVIHEPNGHRGMGNSLGRRFSWAITRFIRR